MGRSGVEESRRDEGESSVAPPDLLHHHQHHHHHQHEQQHSADPPADHLRDRLSHSHEHAPAADASEEPQGNAVPTRHHHSDTSRRLLDPLPTTESSPPPTVNAPLNGPRNRDAHDRRFHDREQRPTESSISGSATSHDSNADSSSTVVTSSTTTTASFPSPHKSTLLESGTPALSTPKQSPQITVVAPTVDSTQSTPTPAKVKPQKSLPSLSSIRIALSQISQRSPKTPVKSAKRHPASRSSHGIATADGPPPSLITRQSYNSDLGRLYRHNDGDQPRELTKKFGPPIVRPGSGSRAAASPKDAEKEGSARRKSEEAAGSKSTNRPSHDGKVASPNQDTKERNKSQDMTRGLRSDPLYEDDYLVAESQTRREESTGRESERSNGGETSTASEDLFMQLAKKQDAPVDDSGVTRRKSKIARIPQRQSLPSHYTPPSRLRRDSIDHGSEYSESPRVSVGGESVSRYRRASTFTTPTYRNIRESSPLSPSSLYIEPNKSRSIAASPLSPGVSPTTQLPSADAARKRRPSVSESIYSSSGRQRPYRPSRLHYDSSLDFNIDSAIAGLHQAQTEENNVTIRPGRPRAQSRTAVDATTESVGSNPTTAPSTVWDELDDIKSRIRKLELTGKLPATSGAAISALPHTDRERPRTAGTGATTTITTMSSSPRRATVVEKRSDSLGGGTDSNVSPTTAASGAGAAPLHPLLHDALTRAKELLPSSVYSSLEVAANDALELAAMASSSHPGPHGAASVFSQSMVGLNNFGSSNVDRKIKRKVDSLCRSITELAIAMCDGRMDTNQTPTVAVARTRPRSRDGASRRISMNGDLEGPPVSYPLVNYARNARSVSLEPDSELLRSTPSRALDRIEARRSSLLVYQTNSATNSPRESTHPPNPTLTPNQPSSENKLAVPSPQSIRSGTSLLRSRHAPRAVEASSPLSRSTEQAAEIADSIEDSPIRVPSRATTEISPDTRRSLSERRHFNLAELRASRTKRLSLGRDGPASSATSTASGAGVYTSNVPLPETRSSYLTPSGSHVPPSTSTGAAKEGLAAGSSGAGYAHGLRRVQMGLNIGTGERAATRIDTSRVPMSAGTGTRRFLDPEGKRTSVGGSTVGVTRSASLRSRVTGQE